MVPSVNLLKSGSNSWGNWLNNQVVNKLLCHLTAVPKRWPLAHVLQATPCSLFNREYWKRLLASKPTSCNFCRTYIDPNVCTKQSPCLSSLSTTTMSYIDITSLSIIIPNATFQATCYWLGLFQNSIYWGKIFQDLFERSHEAK